MDDPRARYRCLADGCGFRWEEPAGRKPIVQPDPEKPGQTYGTWPSRTVVCPACEHPYVRWENYAEHDWNAPARHSGKAVVPRRRAARVMNRAALILPLAFLLANGVAAGAAPAWTDIDAEPLIERCWAISEEDRASDITRNEYRR